MLLVDVDIGIELEHEDLKKIIKMGSEKLIDKIVQSRNVLIRRRARVNQTRNIIERMTDTKASKSRVRYIDIISAKIDCSSPTEIVMDTAEKIEDKEEREAVLCLFIMRKAYKLFKNFFRSMIGTGVGFSVHYINLAIEYDAFDILELLRKTYPEEMEMHKTDFIPSLIITFDNSCGFLQQKLQILRGLIRYMTFSQAQKLLLVVKQKIEEEKPIKNLLLYSPNLILDCCLLHELAYLCEQRFPLLSAIGEPIRARATVVGSNFVESIDN